MTLTAPELSLPPNHLLRQILEAIAAHPEVREPLLRALLTEDFLSLPGQVTDVQTRLSAVETELTEFRSETQEQFRQIDQKFRQVDERFNQIDEKFRQVDERFRQVDERFNQIDEKFRQVDERFNQIDEKLDENTRIIRILQGAVGHLRGEAYEDLCRAQIGVILDGWLPKPVLANREPINQQLLEARHQAQITREEYLDGLQVDIIACAQDSLAQPSLLAVVEVSITFNQDDLAAAARRAALIGRVTGLATAAFLVTNHPWPEELDAIAARLGVTVIRHHAPQYALE